MNRNYRSTHRRWALIVLSAAVLTLAGCGRKGPLDLPPTASSQDKATAQANADHEPAAPSQPSLFDPSYGSNNAPATPKGTKKPFVLDPLLNSN